MLRTIAGILRGMFEAIAAAFTRSLESIPVGESTMLPFPLAAETTAMDVFTRRSAGSVVTAAGLLVSLLPVAFAGRVGDFLARLGSVLSA